MRLAPSLRTARGPTARFGLRGSRARQAARCSLGAGATPTAAAAAAAPAAALARRPLATAFASASASSGAPSRRGLRLGVLAATGAGTGALLGASWALAPALSEDTVHKVEWTTEQVRQLLSDYDTSRSLQNYCAAFGIVGIVLVDLSVLTSTGVFGLLLGGVCVVGYVYDNLHPVNGDVRKF